MKKARLILGFIVRLLGITAPGVLFGWYVWPLTDSVFALLSSVGVEAIWLTLAAFVVVLVQAVKDAKAEREKGSSAV